MFDSLNDQMRAVEDSKEAQKERLLHYGLISLIALVVVGVFFLAMRFAS